jgi:hypothetical protein
MSTDESDSTDDSWARQNARDRRWQKQQVTSNPPTCPECEGRIVPDPKTNDRMCADCGFLTVGPNS